MELKVATIYTIDRENNTTTKNVPEDDIKFNEYLHKVLITMANNKIVKNYKSKAKNNASYKLYKRYNRKSKRTNCL